MSNPKQNEMLLWKRLKQSYMEFGSVLNQFLSKDVDYISQLKTAIKSGDRWMAIALLHYLNEADLIKLFDELIFLASFSHGAMSTVRKIILSMPRDWVLTHIESIAEPFIIDGTYDEYRSLLGLYIDLDHDLALKLAQRAISNSDDDIREAGLDFINKLERPT